MSGAATPFSAAPAAAGPPPYLDAAAVASLPFPAAADAIIGALAGGLDPAADPVRAVIPVAAGQLLLMPAEGGGYAGVKVVGVAPANPAAGKPRIQGVYLLLDGPTLQPVALLDGTALTALRTAAVSVAAARLLAAPDARRLVVFGSGPQARAHIVALQAVLPLREVVVVGRSAERAQALAGSVRGIAARVGTAKDVTAADVVVCATTASRPLFPATDVPDHAVVIAVGSHQPEVLELDPALLGRSQVIVEDPATALREAGEVVRAVSAGVLDADALVGLAALVTGSATVDRDRPRVFKSVGMGWEDLVVAVRVWEFHRPGSAQLQGDDDSGT